MNSGVAGGKVSHRLPLGDLPPVGCVRPPVGDELVHSELEVEPPALENRVEVTGDTVLQTDELLFNRPLREDPHADLDAFRSVLEGPEPFDALRWRPPKRLHRLNQPQDIDLRPDVRKGDLVALFKGPSEVAGRTPE